MLEGWSYLPKVNFQAKSSAKRAGRPNLQQESTTSVIYDRSFLQQGTLISIRMELHSSPLEHFPSNWGDVLHQDFNSQAKEMSIAWVSL